MRVYGLDFTSAPRKGKPITCAVCRLSRDELRLEGLEGFTTFGAFERFLRREGAWIAGIDAPFGQPRALIEALGWPDTWAAYARHVGQLGKPAFEATLSAFMAQRPPGQKELKREADRRAGAISPMKLAYVPVAKMFYQLAPRLAATPLDLPLLRPSGDPRKVVETYPALVARGFGPYKHEQPQRQSAAHYQARAALLASLLEARPPYPRLLLEPDQHPLLLGDPKGDALDAILCALQAAWAYARRDRAYGAPSGADALEGWIYDPTLNPEAFQGAVG